MTITVKKIADAAQVVGRQREEREAAWVANLKAKASLLDAVVEAVRPALPALVNRLPDFDVSAAFIVGDRRVVRELYLNDQGVFIEVMVNPNTNAPSWCPLTTIHVATEYDVERIVSRLADLIVAQSEGKSPMRTAALLSKARQIEAVAELLRGQKS